MGKTIKGVTHKRTKDGKTACGISLFDVKKSNATFRGVTCGRCLRVKNKRVVKTVRRTKAKIKVTASSAQAYTGGE
jgi:predicted PP-loop superfamily ATPase